MDDGLARALKLVDLVGGSIGCFVALFQLLLVSRQPPPRSRVIVVAVMLFLLSFSAIAWWSNDELGFHPVVRLMGPLQVSIALLFASLMTGKKSLWMYGGLIVFFLVVDVADLAPLSFTPDPETRRTALAGTLFHLVPVLAIIGWASWRGVRAVRAGERDLKAFVIGAPPIVLMYVLHMLGSLGVVGSARMPTGPMALALSMVTTWWLFDRTARSAASGALELGGYRLLDRLGHGGMAEVFLGERSGPGGFKKRVAIKRMLPAFTDDPGFRDMFLDEARLAARLSHENIVPIHELGSESGVYFLVMEYLTGLSLARIRTKGAPMDPDVVVAVGAQLLAGLAYAHALSGDDGRPLGLVHRDISPQNLMIDDRGNVRILDFGIAQAAGRTTRTETGAVKGKAAYMAPEQLDGTIDARADLFAAGVVLCELACGHRPLEGDDVKTMASLLRRHVPLPEGLAAVPASLRAVIERALAPDPDARFASASEMRAALLTALPVDLEAAKAKLGALILEVQRARVQLLEGAPTPITRHAADAETVIERPTR